MPIYEYGVIDEIVTTETVATGYVEKDIPQSALRNKWDYLDVMIETDNPVALTLNSGDLTDLKEKHRLL